MIVDLVSSYDEFFVKGDLISSFYYLLKMHFDDSIKTGVFGSYTFVDELKKLPKKPFLFFSSFLS